LYFCTKSLGNFVESLSL